VPAGPAAYRAGGEHSRGCGQGEIIALLPRSLWFWRPGAIGPDAVVKILKRRTPQVDPPHRSSAGYFCWRNCGYSSKISISLRLTAVIWARSVYRWLLKRDMSGYRYAGLDRAVRIKRSPVFFRKSSRAFGGPMAAPSANRFGNVSRQLRSMSLVS